jgi:hypothetical protein
MFFILINKGKGVFSTLNASNELIVFQEKKEAKYYARKFAGFPFAILEIELSAFITA